MSRRPSQYWRLFRAALAFALAGIVGLSTSLLLGAWMRRRDRRSHEAQLKAQNLSHRASRLEIRAMEALGLIHLETRSIDRLRDRPVLFVANHPSLIDTILILSYAPQMDCIANRGWGEHPLVRSMVRACGHPSGEGRSVVEESVQRLRAGRSVLIFPEGSRTPREGLRPFQRGAAHIALRSGVDLQPVLIQIDPRALLKGDSLWDLPDQRLSIRVRILDPIAPKDHLNGDESDGHAARKLTAVLQEVFEKGWKSGVA